MVSIAKSRQGQSGLEYVFLIGVAAAALVAMIFYLGRGHQGGIRNQADSLSYTQYQAGKTHINNNTQTKVTNPKTEGFASSTTVTHPERPVGEINQPFEDKLKEIQTAQAGIYELMDEWEQVVVTDGLDMAAYVAAGNWPWFFADGDLIKVETELGSAITEINDLNNQAKDLSWLDENGNYKPGFERQPDITSTGSSSWESGTITTTKTINERISDF